MQSIHQECGARAPHRGSRRAAGQETTRGPEHPVCKARNLPGSPREAQPEGHKEELPEGGGCGSAVSTSCDLETVCALPFPHPHPLTGAPRGPGWGLFPTQRHRAVRKRFRVELLPGTVGVQAWDSGAARTPFPGAATWRRCVMTFGALRSPVHQSPVPACWGEFPVTSTWPHQPSSIGPVATRVCGQGRSLSLHTLAGS